MEFKNYGDSIINGLEQNSLEILFIFRCSKPTYKFIIDTLLKEDNKQQILTEFQLKDESTDGKDFFMLLRVFIEISFSKDIWIPRYISDMDNCNHLMLKFEPEMATDHPVGLNLQ